MESTICLPTEWTLKAGGYFRADSVFLIKKATCAVVKDIAIDLERKFGHASKSAASAFVDVWKQMLVVRVVPYF